MMLAESGTRVTLTDPGAVCLDGSPGIMYVDRGSEPAGFFIYMQGGGWCQTAEECAQRANTTLGSSTQWPASQPFPWRETSVLMTRNASLNPLMSKWTYVFLPYCDGASFAGDTASGGLHSRGLRIRQAVVAELRHSVGFGAATDVVIGGCSAGAAAVYMHLDWFAAQAPQAKVRGAPDSGWFVEGDYARDRKPHYSSRMANMFAMVNA